MLHVDTARLPCRTGCVKRNKTKLSQSVTTCDEMTQDPDKWVNVIYSGIGEDSDEASNYNKDK